MRVNLDMLVLDNSSFNVTNYIAFSFTFGLYLDEHYRHLFHKNNCVDGNTEKLIPQPRKVTLSSCIWSFFIYIRYKKGEQILAKRS